MKKLIYLFALSVGLLSACEKGDMIEHTKYDIVGNGGLDVSQIKFFNASPGSPVINLYVNDAKTSGVSVTNGIETGGFAYNGVYPDLGYAAITPGTNDFKFKVVGGAAADAGLSVYEASVNTETGKYYSFFTAGLYNTGTKTIPESFLIADVKPALDTSKIFVRLVNMYTGGPSLDLIQFATGQKIVGDVAYGTTSTFVEIPSPGLTNKYGFNDFSTDLPASATTASYTFTKGRAYTIIARGQAGNATFPFALNYYTTFY